MSVCREAGGAWADGEPCGMDAPREQRCDWHTPGVGAALAHVAENVRHLWTYWDLVSIPGTDETIAQALEHRGHLRRLREELGPRLASACFHAALEIYRETPGKRWPIRHQRHVEDCDQPVDQQGRSLCDCPALFEWEVEDQNDRDRGDDA